MKLNEVLDSLTVSKPFSGQIAEEDTDDVLCLSWMVDFMLKLPSYSLEIKLLPVWITKYWH